MDLIECVERHRNFYANYIDVDKFFKCQNRVQNSKIRKCEKIYFQGSEELKVKGTGCITHNLCISEFVTCVAVVSVT